MSTFTGQKVKDTYIDLLQLGNGNLGVTGTVNYILDGAGNTTPLGLSTTTIGMGGHIIPSANAQYDIGSAEYKVRHLFLSDNSLHVGDSKMSETFFTDLSTFSFNDGNVGIGTTNPEQKLHIEDGFLQLSRTTQTNNFIRFQETGKTSFNVGTDVREGAFYITGQSFSNDKLVTVKSDGNVGIGTANPTVPLHIPTPPGKTIATGNVSDGTLLIGLSSLGLGFDNNEIVQVGNALNIGTYLTSDQDDTNPIAGAIRFIPRGSEAMRVTGDGNVGIGTETPDAILELANDHSPEIIFTDKTAGDRGSIDFQDGDFRFWSNYLSAGPVAGFAENHLTIKKSGKVGIGTANPSGLLTVDGDIFINPSSQTVATNGGVLRLATSYTNAFVASNQWYDTSTQTVKFTLDGHSQSINMRPQTGNIEFRTTAISGTENTEAIPEVRMTINPNGNVGIGTTDPASKLHVIGGNGLDEGIILGGRKDDDTTLTTLRFFHDDSDHAHISRGANEVISMSHDGNVGIGTASPQVKFYVRDEFPESTHTTGGLLTGANPSIARFLQAYNHVGNSGANGDYLDIAILGKPDGHYKGMHVSSGYGTLSFGARNIDDAHDGQKEHISIANSGYVGIGDPAPSYKLDVAGDINFTGTLYQDGTAITPAGSSGGSGGTSNWTFDNGNLYPNVTNYNVGIGTSTPQNTLTIRGSGTKDFTAMRTSLGGVNEDVFYTIWSAAAGFQVHRSEETQGNLIIGINTPDGASFTGTGGNIEFRTNADGTYAERMRIDTNGNVGIGTAEPSQKLHVEGVFRSSVTNQPDAYSQLTWGGGLSRDNGGTGNIITTQPALIMHRIDQDGNSDRTVNIHSDNVSYFNGGNVGIGTETPQTPLDVAGNVTANSFQAVTDSGYSAVVSKTNDQPAIKFMGVNSSVGLNYSIGVDSIDADNNKLHINRINDADITQQNLLTIKSDGKVGIGTTTPNHNLSVAGSGTNTNAQDHSAGATIEIHNTNETTDGAFTALNFKTGDKITGSVRSASTNQNDNDGDLTFYTVHGGDHILRSKIFSNGTFQTLTNSDRQPFDGTVPNLTNAQLCVGAYPQTAYENRHSTIQLNNNPAGAGLNSIGSISLVCPDTNTSKGDLVFCTDAGNPSTRNEAMRLTNDGNMLVAGDITATGLISAGTVTTQNQTTQTIEDKHIILGAVANGGHNDASADGGGMILKGTTDKSLKWENLTGWWVFDGNTRLATKGGLRLSDSGGVGTLDITPPVTYNGTIKDNVINYFNTTDLVFKGNDTERLRLTNAGVLSAGQIDASALEIKGGSEPFTIYDANDEKKLRTYTQSSGSVLALTDGGSDIIRLDGRTTTPNSSYFNGGNVGIGTADPTELLEVHGDIKLDTTGSNDGGVLHFGVTSDKTKIVGRGPAHSGSPNTIDFMVSENANATPAVAMQVADGSVGINGAASQYGKLTINGAGDAGDRPSIRLYNTQSGRPGYLGYSHGNVLTFGAHGLNSATNKGSFEFRIGDGSGDRIATLDVDGLHIVGDISCTGTLSGAGGTAGGAGGGGATLWNLNGTSATYTDGNVGIGTDNPAEALHIKGDGARVFISSDDHTLLSLGRRSGTGTGIDAALLAMYKDGDKVASIDTDGHTFFNGGNVGIGTETPNNTFEVKPLTGDYGIHIIGETATSQSRGGLWKTVDDTLDLYLKDANADAKVHLTTVTDDPSFIMSDVGIGTTSPSYSLDVHTVNGGGIGVKGASDTNDGWRLKPTGNDLQIVQNLIGGGEAITFQDGGNVGIGTTAPQNMLNIGANDGAGYGLTVNSPTLYGANIITSGDNSGAVQQTTGSLYVRHKDGGDEYDLFKVTSGGNVGIGTDNPLNKLHVESWDTAVVGSPAGALNGSHNTEGFFRMTAQGLQNEVNSMSAEIRLAQGPDGVNGSGVTHSSRPEGKIEFAVSDGAYGDDPGQNPPLNGNDYGRTPTEVVTEIDSTGLRQVGDVTADGTVLTSDNRIKHNEQTVENAIDIINQLTPKKYIKTVEMYDENHNFEIDEQGAPVDDQGLPVKHVVETGLIAQDLMQIQELNHVVRDEVKDKDGQVKQPMGVDYNSLFTYAVAAIKEQQVMIETMKQEIETLKNS